jgi:hypothetical protein
VAGQSLTKEEHFQRHKDTKISANENKNKRKNTNLSKEKLKKQKKNQQIIHENVLINEAR